MDNTLKKSDISKRILETRKQTEELKAQLQNLIDSGINSSLEYKNTVHSHLDKENIKETQNKVQIIKSYDTKHSQHITKPSSSKINLTQIENQDKHSIKARSYDVNKAREYIKKQKEKRLEQQKLQNEEKKKTEIQKQKLQELHKKSLELVTKNVQAKRERSKSRERINFVRPVKDIPRSRSPSQEKGCINRKKTESNDKYGRRGKSVERLKNVPSDPNLLYPPLPNYLLQTEEDKTIISKKKSPVTHNKIVIISGNSSDKKTESPKSNMRQINPLKPKNLFNAPKNTNTLCPLSQHTELKVQMQTINSIRDKEEAYVESRKTNIVSDNTETKATSRKPNSNNSVKQELLKAKDLEANGKSNEKVIPINNILEYKNIQNKNSSNINLQLLNDVTLTRNCNNLEKPKAEIAIGTDNLEKFTRETQTNTEPKHEFPSWLQEKRFQSNPLNFINTVKRKLQCAINSPIACVDVGVQSSFAQQNFKPDTPQNTKSKEELIEILQHSAKSSKKSDLRSFISHKCLNLDQKTISNIELIPKNFSGNIFTSKNIESGSESDTSKNIPEISSESGTSLRKNAESVKQNGTIGLDIEKLNSLKLRTHKIDKNTQRSLSEDIQTEATSQPYSKTADQPSVINSKLIKIISNSTINTKTETKQSASKLSKNDQYTSDFQSGSGSAQSKTTTNSSKNTNYQNLMVPQTVLYSEKHSNTIPKDSEKHSKISIMTNKESEKPISSCNITIRDNSLRRNISDTTLTQSYGICHNSIKENISSTKDISTTNKTSSNTSIETETQKSKNKFEESQKSESIASDGSSKKSDKYKSLYTDFHPSGSISEIMSKSDSNLQFINTRRGSHSRSSKFLSIPPLKEPTLSLIVNKDKVNGPLGSNEDGNKLLKNISLRSDTNKFADQNNTNEIHLKFEAEIHLLNDFNESLRQFSEVEKAFHSLKSKNDVTGTTDKILQNQDTQTSVVTKSSSSTTDMGENSISDDKSELSSINFSRGFVVDADSSSLNVDTSISKLEDANNADDLLNINITHDLSNFENLQSHNFAGMTLRMFEQLIKDEDVRLENLKTILKIREQALLDRTKGELAWLEIQRKHLRETGKLHEASLIKKKQRGILVNHQKERHEMQRYNSMLVGVLASRVVVSGNSNLFLGLKQMQKAASIERKIILREQRNLIKHQLSTDKMLSKIKVNAPRERRLSGPLKVIQSHTESIRSETSFSRRSSSEKEKETYSVMSHTQSIVSMVSEVSDEVFQKDGAQRADSMDLAIKLPSEACGVPISQMKRTLLIREAALQKRRKAALELLQWHRKLLEEEKRITELESTANTIISQIPSNAPASPDVEKYQFKGKQLNQLWFNLTGCKEKKFSESKIYPMSQIALERFCKSAREYSTKAKTASDGDISATRTDDINENIPDHKVTRSASISESGRSSHKKEINTANDYTSDFDVESLQDVVNIEVDKSINQLIDNFSKIQEDISSLSIKQSLKSDESIKSDKTDSDVEVSVIETAKTSKEKSLEEPQLKLIVNNSSKTLSTSEVSRSKSPASMPDLVSSSEVPSVDENREPNSELDRSSNRSFYDESPFGIEENELNIEGKNNLNKSLEILEELSYLETPIDEDMSPDRELTVEDVQIINKAKDNLSKTEDILSRLSHSEDKHSIIPSTDNELENRGSEMKSDGVLLDLRPLDDFLVLSNQETEQLHTDDTSKNIPISNKSEITEDVCTASKDEDNVLNEEKIDLGSEIISEKLIEIEEYSETSVETSEKAAVNGEIEEISDTSNKILSIVQDDTISKENKTEEDRNASEFEDNVQQSKQSSSEEVVISQKKMKDSYSIPVEEISEVSPSRGETEQIEELSTEKKTKTDEDDTEIKDKVSSEDTPNDLKTTESAEQIITREKITEELSSKDNELISSENVVEEKSETNDISTAKSSMDISNSEKLIPEEQSEDVAQPTVPDIVPSSTEETDKSQTSSIAENVTALLSKEDINSFEEKELDSLAPSTTGSQTSMLSERDENQLSEWSKSSTTEEKSPQSGTVDVKKRVSEIMADASQLSRGDKSPKLQDFYTTTYDLMSPANSPELGSPTEENKIIAAKTIFGNEAEELLRKQLAIEQEIKQITEQQQKEQVPFAFVREIPNKPPPPYTPPSSLPATNVITIIPTNEEIENITKYSAKILHKAYLSNNLDNISISENTLSLISKNITKECYKFVFDLCKEISKEHYKQFEKEHCLAWLQVKKNPRLAVVKPLDVIGLEKHMGKKLKELFGYQKPMRRENAIIKWSRKKRDHVDEILVMESQTEETQWTNYDKDELLVMNEVTNEIMNMLLKETGEVFSKILSKQTL